jgi:hypothetical protein
MESELFLNNQNVEMIWEIIQDEEIMRHKTEKEKKEIQELFINDIQVFFQRVRTLNYSLMEMNKQFIDRIINILNSFDKKSIDKPIVTSLLITAQDIQSSRINEFEKQLANKQMEFTNSITLKTPEKPNFEDEMDRPIGEMEDLIARTLAQRNFDIEQINQSFDKQKVEGFLKGQETSIKNNANVTPPPYAKYNVSVDEVKFIKILDDDISDPVVDVIDIQEERHITWADQSTASSSSASSSSTSSIFSKLKPKITPSTNTLQDNLKTDEFQRIHNKIDALNDKLDRFISSFTKLDQT